MENGTKDKLVCKLCGWEWTPKKFGKLPAACPRCKRYDWDKDKPAKEE